ncbi:Gfo/Idh/MocA family oxidoreductase [Leucobacter allii]|uniref:Gfo/Idh/MocA family oxidoreductase n=1 Tax=Leucobacter allii TaxID=2932247 RepID=A0ABY4FKZ9_9MICO|nr:Gfo/Idh/MocA family oxidoreductase [Leucobacter allii]UOQ56945.1 Gfo/Idh/MocA family oxidoreductase [Leucobacter allii]
MSASPHAEAAPLRIGMLGASRIAELAILEASAATGEILAAVAARDPERARAYAAEHGFARVHEDYGALLADDSLDLVYIGLPNGLHAEWTARALDAGRNVLVEKPFAANLAEFDRVAARLEAAEGWAWEAFHYADHPALARLIAIVRDGGIGRLRQIEVRMEMPAPPASDPRWSFDLAGGAMMDLGCYALNVLLLLGEELGADPTPAIPQLRSARAVPYAPDPRVDATVEAELSLAGIPVDLRTSMESDGWDFSLRLVGDTGEVLLPNFVKPQEDGRLIVRGGGAGAGAAEAAGGAAERVERVSGTSSYAFQLRRIRAAVRGGERATALLARSRRTMALIDEISLASGLPLRPGRLAD